MSEQEKGTPPNKGMKLTKPGELRSFAALPRCSTDQTGERESGYNVARVRFEIILSPDAGKALAALPAHTRSQVRDGIEVHLRYEPTKPSKSRIKRLRGLERPQYRLRVGEMRVFYDVTEAEVHVLAVISKSEAQAWLDDQGIPAPAGGPGKGEG